MSTQHETPLGTLRVLPEDAFFRATAEFIAQTAEGDGNRTVALTGGSTPKGFYAWAREAKPFSSQTLQRVRWYTSDERMVPLESEESNFGVADRGLFTPLGVKEGRKFPWPVMVDAHSAAGVFNTRWDETYGRDDCFDLCFLGMGDDGHTASIFPGSPLIETPIPDNFACVEVPEKGWRLTVTREGLGRCGRIVLLVMGAKKAAVLKEAIEGPLGRFPVQLLADQQERVTLLADAAAAGELSL
ncbi:MAG: 6-phosphogluconolactonase [Verrucomicrobiota bacterium]